MSATFIGIDLAWKSDSQPSGAAVLQGDVQLELMDCSQKLASLDEIVAYVERQRTDTTVVAIDAPLVIANVAGQRPCETAVGRKYGSRGASAHSSNLTLYPDPRGVRLAHLLQALGFTHVSNPTREQRRPGHWMLEVYPHPATVVLFALERILDYKKGQLERKREGLARLADLLRTRLGSGEPALKMNTGLECLLSQNLDNWGGKELKRHEDSLDAILCAYIAAFYWYWGATKNEILGDLQTGYIVNPIRPC